jgi:hypothetical protein
LVAAARLADGPGSDFERVPKGRALPVRERQDGDESDAAIDWQRR